MSHHLRVLENRGEVRFDFDGWQTHLYLAGATETPAFSRSWVARLPCIEDPQAGRLSAQTAAAMRRGPQENGQQRRESIVRLVSERPGVRKADVARLLGLSWNNTCYHVDLLQRALAVRVHQQRGQAYLFPAQMPPGEFGRLTALASPKRLGIALAIAEAAPATIDAVAKRAGLTPRSARRHVAALRDAGVLGSGWPLRMTTAARKVLARLGAAAADNTPPIA